MWLIKWSSFPRRVNYDEPNLTFPVLILFTCRLPEPLSSHRWIQMVDLLGMLCRLTVVRRWEVHVSVQRPLTLRQNLMSPRNRGRSSLLPSSWVSIRYELLIEHLNSDFISIHQCIHAKFLLLFFKFEYEVVVVLVWIWRWVITDELPQSTLRICYTDHHL